MLKRILTLCAVLAIGALPSLADIYGSPNPLTGAGYSGSDTYFGSANVYLPLGPLLGAGGQTVISYSFFSVTSGTDLTPVLWTQIGGLSSTTFQVQAIGQTDSSITSGANNNVAFVPVSGSALVGADTYFGWVDGNLDGSVQNTGSIALICCSGGPGGQPGYQTANGAGYPIGNSLTFYTWAEDGQGLRPYDMNVTTTPEPTFYGVLALGLAGLITGFRRRKNA